MTTSDQNTGENQENGQLQVVADADGDFICFKEHLSNPHFKVPCYFDKKKWTVGETFQLRVGHVYDPSHFWIVTKYKELEALQNYLSHFYTIHKEDYKIEYEWFKLNMYCVCYTEESYYRGIFTGIERQYTMTNYAFVFLIDYGYMAKVPITELYFMTTNMYDIPRCAVRATLAEVCPTDLKCWSSQAVNNFNAEVQDVILTGMVTHVAASTKVLFLRLSKLDGETGLSKFIGDNLLLQEDINLFMRKNVKKLESKLLFLEPSFEKLEKGGLVPDMHVIAKGLSEKLS